MEEEILKTLASVSEYNIFESEEIVVPDDLLKMNIWEIPRNYSIWSQRQISQNKISLRSFVINVTRSFEGHIFTTIKIFYYQKQQSSNVSFLTAN